MLRERGTGNGEQGTGNGEPGTGATNGLATVTVSSAGKVSGKFTESGKTWTFSAPCYTGFDGTYYGAEVTAKRSYKSGKKTVTETRAFYLQVQEGAYGGAAQLVESVPNAPQLLAQQNLWKTTYKAVGAKLFYTSKKKQYKTFTIKSTDPVGAAIGLTDKMSLSLKVTTAGAVAATLTYDTGKKSKGRAVYYKPACATVVWPTSAADPDAFTGEIYLYFAPSTGNNFPGMAGKLDL